ncbi:Acot8 [Symbiodinium microadriaticum]|nr:Acot8 [Symbiodinium microadriaticum]
MARLQCRAPQCGSWLFRCLALHSGDLCPVFCSPHAAFPEAARHRCLWPRTTKVSCCIFLGLHLLILPIFLVLVAVVYGTLPRNCQDSSWQNRCQKAASLTLGDVMLTLLYQTLGVGGYIDLKENYSDAPATQHDWVFLIAAYLGNLAHGFIHMYEAWLSPR